MSYKELYSDKSSLLLELKSNKEEYEKKKNCIEKKIDTINNSIDILNKGFNMESVNLALSILYIKGAKYLTDGTKFEDSIQRWKGDILKDILNGFPKLRDGFMGFKDYAGFSGQRCDCQYGYGPSHGSVFLEIGLCSRGKDLDFTEKEIDACIYYVNNLEQITK